MGTQQPSRIERDFAALTAAAASVASLPSSGTDVPGLWIVATESGTRYVVVVPPEGQARVNRVASYGWSRNTWRRPHHGVSRHPRQPDLPLAPATVGAEMYVDMGPSRHDYYRSTEVVSITSYPLPTLLSVHEIKDHAYAAMRDLTIDLTATAYAEGRIDDETVAAICAEQGFTLAEVQERFR